MSYYTLHSAQVIWGKDLAEDSPVPWYLPLDGGQFSITNFRATAIGRCVTKYMVSRIKIYGSFFIILSMDMEEVDMLLNCSFFRLEHWSTSASPLRVVKEFKIFWSRQPKGWLKVESKYDLFFVGSSFEL